MKEFSKSEDWLALLLWGLDLAIHPSPRKFLRSFEWWDYQNRIKPQLWRLQRAKLLERRGHADNQALHLTPQGRLKANGGIDAVARWERAWDGKWRMLIFDLPVGSQPLRLKLWRWLRS